MAAETEAVMAPRDDEAEPEQHDGGGEHPRAAPHAGENGILSPDPTEAPPAASHDAANGHLASVSSALDSDREDAGMTHALAPADKADSTRGHPVPDIWKKRCAPGCPPPTAISTDAYHQRCSRRDCRKWLQLALGLAAASQSLA